MHHECMRARSAGGKSKHRVVFEVARLPLSRIRSLPAIAASCGSETRPPPWDGKGVDQTRQAIRGPERKVGAALGRVSTSDIPQASGEGLAQSMEAGERVNQTPLQPHERFPPAMLSKLRRSRVFCEPCVRASMSPRLVNRRTSNARLRDNAGPSTFRPTSSKCGSSTRTRAMALSTATANAGPFKSRRRAFVSRHTGSWRGASPLGSRASRPRTRARCSRSRQSPPAAPRQCRLLKSPDFERDRLQNDSLMMHVTPFVNLLHDRKTRCVAIFEPLPILDRRPQQLRLPTIRWLGALSDRNRVVDGRGR